MLASTTSKVVAIERPYELPSSMHVTARIVKDLVASVPNLSTPFLAVDADKLLEPVRLWHSVFPDVKPYYARKAHAHPAVLKLFAKYGCGFDVANGGEIEDCKRHEISLQRAIVTNPVRDKHDICAILSAKPESIVVHGVEGLRMLAAAGIPSKEYAPKLYFRIALPLSNLHRYGGDVLNPVLKNGRETMDLDAQRAFEVFKEARLIERVTGVPFKGFGLAGHGGTNNEDTSAWDFMLRVMYCVATFLESDEATEMLGAERLQVRHFDIGGGYICGEKVKETGLTQRDHLLQIAAYVGAFRSWFPHPVEIIAEPGRFFVSSGFNAIIGVKEAERRINQQVAPFTFAPKEHMVIHIDDGVYQLLMNAKVEHRRYAPGFVRLKGPALTQDGLPGVLFGASCDPYDEIALVHGQLVPKNLAPGDLLILDGMGPYSTETFSPFNRTKEYTLVLYSQSEGALTGWTHYDARGVELSSSGESCIGSTEHPPIQYAV